MKAYSPVERRRGRGAALWAASLACIVLVLAARRPASGASSAAMRVQWLRRHPRPAAAAAAAGGDALLAAAAAGAARLAAASAAAAAAHPPAVVGADGVPGSGAPCASVSDWPLALGAAEASHGSQGGQDGVLAAVFAALGETNRFFVEAGFDADAYEGGVGANTRALYARGWRGLLLDGSHANATINLHHEFLCPETFSALLDAHGVPTEPDYVSIDVDSHDVWLLRAMLAGGRRPRVATVEYNMNFPPGSTLAWAPGACGSEGWRQDRLMGSSLGAVYELAAEFGYVVAHVLPVTDAVLVRGDLAACARVEARAAAEARVAGRPLHAPSAEPGRAARLFVDYAAWRASGGDVAAARAAAAHQLAMAPLITQLAEPEPHEVVEQALLDAVERAREGLAGLGKPGAAPGGGAGGGGAE